jgi:regulator of cell morphogenesis and NO signaling
MYMYDSLTNNRYWSDASLVELIDFLEQRHQVILKEKIPQAQQLLDETLKIDMEKQGQVLKPLLEIFTAFISEMTSHIDREEQTLFSYIRKLEIYKAIGGTKPQIPFSSIENPISQIEEDHRKLEYELFEKMRTITSGYQLPPDASDTFKALYESLNGLESEIMEHMGLETDIVFPKAIELELSIMHGNK